MSIVACGKCGSPMIKGLLWPCPTCNPESNTATCVWTKDECGTWYTACGHAFEFNDDDPKANGFTICPYCGARLEEKGGTR